MRNLFDQYDQQENRLTHALVTAIAEDRRLLGKFLRWIGVTPPPGSRNLEVIEQRLPSEVETSEDEAERRGLPDAWIHDNGTWSLLIESKISARLDIGQLKRHHSTAFRRGYDNVTVLVIDTERPKPNLPDWVRSKRWSEVYQWLVGQASQSEWAGRVSRYMEIMEVKMSEDGYLRDGTLTTFSGVPFGEGYPYNYPEARRILGLAMQELRARKDLKRELGIDLEATGRGAITGKQSSAVWDYLRLTDANGVDPHTLFPHFTLSIEHERVLSIVTIPHGIKSEFRRNVVDLGYDQFSELISVVTKKILVGFGKAKGAAPWVIALQRRYPSQRGEAFVDASLEFDLRTAFTTNEKLPVRNQTEWLQATYDALANKRSNYQVAVGASFPYRTCKLTRQRELLDSIAASWIACKPLVEVLVRGQRD